ncbi:MAG: aminopeptidase [Acidobacteria bacterium]|nr:aminopeptidase [Acidobacteriota bacterium]
MRPRVSRRHLLYGLTLGACTSRVALALPSHTAPAPATQRADDEVRFPPIDARRVARRLVDAFQPTAGERALLVYDPTYYPELALAVAEALNAARVYPVLTLTFEPTSLAMLAGRETPEAARRADAYIEFLEPTFARTDIFLWLAGRNNLSPGLRWERLIDASRARAIHNHWVLPPLGARSDDEIRQLVPLYERAILDTDHAALSKEQDKFIAALRNQTMHLTSPDGTDLRMRVPADAWFHKSDGDISAARARRAVSVRDREIEFPAGALRFIPDAESAEGRLVARVGEGGYLSEQVTLHFERGRIVRRQAARDQAAFDALWARMGGDVDKVGEMVLGVNPLLVAALPSGEPPYYGYGAGAVRVSLGENWESGGTLRSPGGPLWLFVPRATLSAGRTTLVTNGALGTL